MTNHLQIELTITALNYPVTKKYFEITVTKDSMISLNVNSKLSRLGVNYFEERCSLSIYKTRMSPPPPAEDSTKNTL